jgi:hypothetical protein
LRELWRNTIAPELNRRSVSTVSNASEALFGTLRDDVRRGACGGVWPDALRQLFGTLRDDVRRGGAEISVERALSAELIRETG